MKRCICFSRVSTEHQNLDPQNEKIINAAVLDGYTRDNIILIEHKESAVKLDFEERLGIKELMNYVEQYDNINSIYIYELSRLSRIPSDLYKIRDYLYNNQINLVCLNPSMKLLNDDGKYNETSSIIFGIFVSLAEQEGYIRKARIKKAVDKNKSLGLHTGGNKMFGYTTNSEHEYIIDHHQGNIIIEIFNMYVYQNMSIRKIAAELNARGISMQTIGKNKNPNSTYLTMCVNINNILKRKEYIGEVTGKPAIISKQLFDKAQEIMKHRTICATRKEVPALLRGMLYDKPSGWLLSANYTCKNYYSKRAKGGASISFECADKIVWDYCKNMYNEMSNKDYQALYSQLQKNYQNAMLKQYKTVDKMKTLKSQIDLVEERIIVGKISKQKAEELETKYENELKELHRQAIAFDEERTNIQKQMNELSEHHENNTDIDLDNMNIEQKINTLKKIVDKIYIERISRVEAIIEIQGIYNSVTYKVDTYHKKII